MLNYGRESGISGTVHISAATNSGLRSVGMAKGGGLLWTEDGGRELLRQVGGNGQ